MVRSKCVHGFSGFGQAETRLPIIPNRADNCDFANCVGSAENEDI